MVYYAAVSVFKGKGMRIKGQVLSAKTEAGLARKIEALRDKQLLYAIEGYENREEE